MVASHGHSRRPSCSGSVSGRSERGSSSRRRSSVRRQSERSLGNPSQSSVRNLRIQQQKRAHSLASETLQPPSTSTDGHRRPSAPARQTVGDTTPQLSIAERFMSANYSKSTLDLPDEDCDTRSKSSMSTAVTASSPSLPTPSMRAPDPRRLTIADTFMKTRSPSVSSDRDRMHDTSQQDRRNSSTSTNFQPSEQVHPLEVGNNRPTGALDSNFHLDLTLPVLSDNNQRRPFGSQATLVQPPAAKTESSVEEAKGSDAFSMRDYYNYDYEEEDCGSSTTQQGDEVMEDKLKNQDASDRWRHLSTEEAASAVHDDSEKAKGVWIGCCFVSCGRRPGNKAMLEEQKRRLRQKQGPRRCGHPGWVFVIFLLFIGIVVTAYVLWPRTPLMRIEGASLVSPAQITETHQGVMVGNVAFESQWLVNVTVDNRQNRVPTRLVRVEVLAKDALTGLTIGKGLHNDDQTDASALVLPPDTISPIQLPVVIDYQARDSSDTTFSNLKSACTSQPPITIYDNKTNQTITQQPEPEAIQLHFWITLYIWGLEWFGYKPTVIATPATGGFACPLS